MKDTRISMKNTRNKKLYKFIKCRIKKIVGNKGRLYYSEKNPYQEFLYFPI